MYDNYGTAGVLSISGSLFSDNWAGDDGWAIFESSAAADIAILNSTFITGRAGDSEGDDTLVITGGARVDWGACAPGWTPGAVGDNVPVYSAAREGANSEANRLAHAPVACVA